MKPVLLLLRFYVPVVSAVLLLTACTKNAESSDAPPPPPEVSVLTVDSEKISLTTELPGRINPMREAQVRARATGILLRRLFEEGANVKEGDVLFEIDPAPLQASLNSVKATLAKTEAAVKESKATLARYKELVKIDAISKQTYDEAEATLAQNDAERMASAAEVESAELNLGYTKVTAPISGRIGKALVTEGALVSATEATQLAVIRQLDPVYLDFTQSSTDVLRLRRAVASGAVKGVDRGEVPVQVMLEDGLTYSHQGKVLFSDISVDPTTGMITLRAQVPNPENILMPGMFARARIVQAVNTNAITVPQRTISRGAGGAATVLVVNDESKVELRPIEIDRIIGNKAIVSSGLREGERIIVEGTQKAIPGSLVKPVPFTPAQPATAQSLSKAN